ncbi:hypothetical protein FHX57_002003 [Paraburkholderia tropica]|uniref:S-adenosylmethionine-binding protein n=1 Tax=Paraburkholderia tropica TaxID=92647 RepID=UPI00161B1475|nr:S-adenosylmethionine-binding protein [Paraburkholderia tropica]MBB2999672.1 hypothetical protein [Paraburkholderia tropica]
MSEQLELHPLCSLFPRLEGDAFEKLKEDIRVNGQCAGIILYEGKILDGGNRYRACLELGIEPWTVEADFDDVSPLGFVLSMNLHRRHLSPGQQAAIVAAGQDWTKASQQGGDRKSDQSATLHFDTAEKRAAESGASLRTQKMADKVQKANPELAKKVAHGEVSLPQAIKQIEESAQEIIDRTGPVARKPSSAIAQEALESAIAERDDARDQLADLAHTARDLELQVEAYRAGEIGEGEQKLLEANQKIAKLEAECRRLESIRDDWMNKHAEALKEIKKLQRRLERGHG